MEEFPTIAILIAVVSCSITDIKSSKIPNFITLPTFFAAIIYHLIFRGFDGIAFGILGAAVGIGTLILPYILGGMGAGDVKLMGAVGSFLGPRAVFDAFLVSALFGGLYAVLLILLRRDAFQGFFREKFAALYAAAALRTTATIEIDTTRGRPRLRYGLAIALGTITYLLLNQLGIKFFA